MDTRGMDTRGMELGAKDYNLFIYDFLFYLLWFLLTEWFNKYTQSAHSAVDACKCMGSTSTLPQNAAQTPGST